ncbi:MAG: TIGR04053 family radical SAM/SPASM domain-containing protein [Acidimicrobiales bacterium]
MNFDKAPALVFWETTQACALACRHCRASAMPEPLPGQLTTDEGLALVEQLGRFSSEHERPPVLVLTGGDVMTRPDLLQLVAAARQNGLPVALAPSVTPRLTGGPLKELRDLGVTSVSISLDGSTPATHEQIRGVPGHFAQTLAAMAQLSELGFKVQVNTAVMRSNADELAGVASLVKDLGATAWEVFFLVKVGRGRDQQELAPSENEDVAHFLFEASHYGFAVRTVEGPWYRRVVAERQALSQDQDPQTAFSLGPLYRRQSRRLRQLLGLPQTSPQTATAGTRDGKGIFFIAHDGWAFPAGFLPLRLGNVKQQDPVSIYRDHPLLKAVRRAEFSGRCGRCQLRDLCGGSRARAWATSGDPLGEDPACAYVPA